MKRDLQLTNGLGIGVVMEMSDDELLAELARGLTLTAEILTRMGAVWAELERRGRDLSHLREGIAKTLPLIASGLLAAEAVVAFAGRPIVLRALHGVPLEQQRRLAAGEEIKIIDPTQPSEVVSLPVSKMPAASIMQVFSQGEIRSPEVQRLAMRQRRQAKPAKTPRDYQPRYDRAAGTVKIGKMTVPLADLLQELASASGPDQLAGGSHPEEYVTVKVRLTKPEMERFLELCRTTELPEWEMARKAMRAFGLL